MDRESLVHIPVDNIILEGSLEIPKEAKAVILFTHGSGSSRLSPRNNYVARVLRQAGLGTLLIDLLSEAEDVDYNTRFDIDLLAKRLIKIGKWLKIQGKTANLKLGLFGASTGAAAAIKAAISLDVYAVVSRGGRPDLAADAIEFITSPVLLIVGGADYPVIDLNKEAYSKIKAEKELVIIPRATHLFDEPKTLEEVAEVAADWFIKKLE